MTLVLDASALCDHLVGGPHAPNVARLIREHAGDVNLPHLALVETASALSRMARRGQITEDRARVALRDLADAPFARWPADALLPRIWELRENLTPYDATYVALAESLAATLLTGDERLVRGAAGRAWCRVVLT